MTAINKSKKKDSEKVNKGWEELREVEEDIYYSDFQKV
jgi:hypothetical protein